VLGQTSADFALFLRGLRGEFDSVYKWADAKRRLIRDETDELVWWLEEEAETVTPHEVDEYVTAMLRKPIVDRAGEVKVGLERSTINTRLAALSWLFKHAACDSDPTRKIEYKRTKGHRIYRQRALVGTQTSQVMAAIDRKTPVGMRDWMLLELMRCMGLRRSDLEGLTPASIKSTPVHEDMQACSLRVLRKGSKRQELIMPNSITMSLHEYVNAFGLEDGHFLFMVVRKGGMILPERPLSVDDMTRIVRERSMAALGTACAPHAWRATFATTAIMAGVPLEQVQRYMGHEKLETTLLYFNDLPTRETSAAEAVHYEEWQE